MLKLISTLKKKVQVEIDSSKISPNFHIRRKKNKNLEMIFFFFKCCIGLQEQGSSVKTVLSSGSLPPLKFLLTPSGALKQNKKIFFFWGGGGQV